jgi:hypothetical protein
MEGLANPDNATNGARSVKWSVPDTYTVFHTARLGGSEAVVVLSPTAAANPPPSPSFDEVFSGPRDLDAEAQARVNRRPATGETSSSSRAASASIRAIRSGVIAVLSSFSNSHWRASAARSSSSTTFLPAS